MIPVNEPLVGERELEYVTECLRSGWISSAGQFVERFEAGWAQYCGRRHGIAVSNGTAALQIAVRACGIGPGDEVIMPAFTIISCALAVIYAGATPVLVDSDPRTWTMDTSAIANKITQRTRAILPVHMYGCPADLDEILELAEHHDLAVIEDAAEAHGAEYLSGRDQPGAEWRRCGSFGDLSCFSFYANKPVTTGEGGMILTDNDALAESARSLRNLCFQPGHRFEHDDLGYNFRFTNVQAAIGLGQLERIDQIIDRKRQIGHTYLKRLERIEALQLPVEYDWAHSIYWMFGVVLCDDVDLDATRFADELERRGVETRPFFMGMHEQPALRACGLFDGERHPVCERLSRRGLYLPTGLALTNDQIGQVCAAVEEVLA